MSYDEKLEWRDATQYAGLITDRTSNTRRQAGSSSSPSMPLSDNLFYEAENYFNCHSKFTTHERPIIGAGPVAFFHLSPSLSNDPGYTYIA